jgi:hypothetical protein
VLKDVLKQDLLQWNPNAFIVDDVDAKINAIEWSSWLLLFECCMGLVCYFLEEFP